jgi:hypothetical protein
MNEQSIQLKHYQERYFSVHNAFIRIALHELELAKPGIVGEFDHALVSIVLSALAVEALGNAIGERVVAQWDDYQSLAPFAKLRLLAEKLGARFAANEEPWATLKWLCRLRNKLAHAKPELVRLEQTITQEQHEARRFDAPHSKLEAEVSESNARRAILAVETIKYMLGDLVPIERRFGLTSDGWPSSTKLGDVA